MILPGSHLFTLILLAFSAICYASWANSVKWAGPKWRFELFCCDFAVGALVAAAVIALTFGSMGLDGFTVMDDLRLAGKRQDLLVFLAGCIFNLANMLLIASISFGGLTVSYPIVFGLSILVGSLLTNSAGNSPILWAGCVLVLGAAIVDALAWRKYGVMKVAEAREAAASAVVADSVKVGKARRPKKKSARGKVIPLAVIGGLLMGAYLPLTTMAALSKEVENGLGPYTTVLIFAIGIAFSTFVYNLFFMNLPLQGNPLEMREYFRATPGQHFRGLVGGIVWCAGAAAWFVASATEGTAAAGPSVASKYLIGIPVIGALWGLFAWKEFDGVESYVRLLVGLMLFLLVAGLALIAVH